MTSPAIPALLAFQRLMPLTRRQRSVMQCLNRGMTNQEIADELGITLNTTKIYCSALMIKIFGHGKGDRLKLILWGLRQQDDADYVALSLAWALQMPRARWPKIEERKA